MADSNENGSTPAIPASNGNGHEPNTALANTEQQGGTATTGYQRQGIAPKDSDGWFMKGAGAPPMPIEVITEGPTMISSILRMNTGSQIDWIADLEVNAMDAWMGKANAILTDEPFPEPIKYEEIMVGAYAMRAAENANQVKVFVGAVAGERQNWFGQIKSGIGNFMDAARGAPPKEDK